MLVEEYLSAPCKSSSIPYWKSKLINVSPNMKILHDGEFHVEDLLEYNDSKYFRLLHDLKYIEKNNIIDNRFSLQVASQNDYGVLTELINACYTDIHITKEYISTLTKTCVYDEKLWVLVVEMNTGKVVGGGIADLDCEIGEGVLEWIQVLPEYRGQKLGQAIVNYLLQSLQSRARFVTVSGKIDNLSNPERLYRKCGFKGNDIWHVMIRKIE